MDDTTSGDLQDNERLEARLRDEYRAAVEANAAREAAIQ